MANFRIAYLNRFDSATLTATPAMVTTAPVTYLQNDARGDIAQATSTASQEIKGHWNGTAYTIGTLALWRHNMLTAETIRLYLYSDVNWTTGVYDSTALAAYASGIFADWDFCFTNRYFTPVASVKSFKIVMSSTATAWQCARIFLGPYTEATYNPLYGWNMGYETNSKQSRSEGGSFRSDTKSRWRMATFDMMMDTEADRAAWLEIGRYCGLSKSFVASLYPAAGGTSERDYTIFGKFDGKSPAQKIASLNLYDQSLAIAEL